MSSLSEIEKRLSAIEERNRRVETDKAWETSRTRRILISTFTYLSVAMYFYAIGVPYPFLNAVVPTVAFLLSTLSLPFLKRQWMKNKNKRKK